MRKAVLAATLALFAAATLTGCTSSTTPTVSASPSPSASVPADPTLLPVYPKEFSELAAEAETIRVANAIAALLPASTVLNVDTHAQLVAATGESGSYYGDLKAISLQPTLDPVGTAEAVAEKLVASGWHQLQAVTTSGVRVITLSSGKLATNSWFVIVSGDPTTSGQSVLSIQLASPDLP